MQETIATLLSALVSHKSVDGILSEKLRLFAFVKDWLQANHVEISVFDHPMHPSLLAEIPGKGDPILLLAHLDVVPAPDRMFVMRREGSKVFGRGVLDDKGSAALLMLLLAETVKQEEPHASLRVLFTTDEEIGSSDGVERLVSINVLTNNRCVIALDGGSEDAVVRAEKGVVHFTLEAVGKSAHNSTPWEGVNAIEKIMKSYERIKQALHEETTPEDRWKTTVSIGTIEGGHFVNQVPGHAKAQIDIRFTEAKELKDVLATIEKNLEEGVKVLGSHGGHPFETAEDDPLLKIYVQCMEHAIGKKMQCTQEHGATDARFFRGMNVPIWLHYPAGGEIHTDDEWMDLASAEKLLVGLKEFMRKV